ncbi:hypothetical protein N7478_007464 [Penicillium angulare]|uniref:uncharacterized protein n=1 Tax=Penicillium angulare TaxID=116970 RepID=UPI002541EA5F|nr:uncharacterized protein N7478_007464 [Penicillium angulare]KAJ5272339.1 hypothetical protein N7478_007464 [Penicillium angulare]
MTLPRISVNDPLNLSSFPNHNEKIPPHDTTLELRRGEGHAHVIREIVQRLDLELWIQNPAIPRYAQTR